MSLSLDATVEHFPIAGTFTISRGSKTTASVVTCRIGDGVHTGSGECVPYGRYGETIDTVLAEIAAIRHHIEAGLSRADLQRAMKPGAARNAVDCALWDLEAKQKNKSAHVLAGISSPEALTTAYTLSLAEPDAMREQAAKYAHRALLKVKVGTSDDAARIRAVRAGAPESRIILDANEGWTPETLAYHFAICAEERIDLIEQPLPAGRDEALATIARPVPICADESVHATGDLAALVGRYDAVNIKLDKTGGLTEALRMRDEAVSLGLKVMVGCMVGSSLAMAPAILVAQGADFVDLDGPLLLAQDREPGLRYEASLVFPPEPRLWG
ncbi:N-acetyl-D-Glu racemase DgcA [Ensifer adhaerens]|jgi:L-alanine-DL-glutamate epimerase-like enolase superfamily enzyme|uniref:Dipeptide epimerase n=1 Tax=Ensifer adhaerens TaxID=106592 RepID=A0A9Q9DB15_ENSAD|nr:MULTISPECIES: N-acetyl-D-Glu racemase DgcA [Ensifer]ANK72566.1 dipeptide epimerase [Ensifer adhaerens]KDP74530.1 mandelate racemase [Ensifer adhaerens]KQX33056.1 mandelate racemase [Ensifer sp. Root423]KQZ58622.1 mandelate racemase [Ensifer sp. Root558]MBD9543617.1 dipeptide epimerase [Ensifer sp. ENS04]